MLLKWVDRLCCYMEAAPIVCCIFAHGRLGLYMPSVYLRRGDLQPGEDPGDFSPNALRKRTPSLALVALFAILDPPREEAIEAAKIAHTAGITVKMITGA